MTFLPGHSHGILSSHESQLPITSCTPGKQLAAVTKSQTMSLSTCHMYDMLIGQRPNLFWKRLKQREEMHRLETEMLLPPSATFRCVTHTQPGGDGSLSQLTVKRARVAAGWREHQLWLLTHSWEDSLQCWHLPLVPESRTPAYRMVSPTCRVFHPQLIRNTPKTFLDVYLLGDLRLGCWQWRRTTVTIIQGNFIL